MEKSLSAGSQWSCTGSSSSCLEMDYLMVLDISENCSRFSKSVCYCVERVCYVTVTVANLN